MFISNTLLNPPPLCDSFVAASRSCAATKTSRYIQSSNIGREKPISLSRCTLPCLLAAIDSNKMPVSGYTRSQALHCSRLLRSRSGVLQALPLVSHQVAQDLFPLSCGPCDHRRDAVDRSLMNQGSSNSIHPRQVVGCY